MFDIGGSELLLIGVVALIVVGPKELPGLIRTVGQYVGKARAMARDFQRSMEDAADESGLRDAANSLKPDGLGLGDFNKSANEFAKSMTGGPASGRTPKKDAAPSDTPAPAAAPSSDPASAASPDDKTQQSPLASQPETPSA